MAACSSGGGTGGMPSPSGLQLKQDFWEYDPTSNNWTPKADFAGGERYLAVGFSIWQKGYIGTGTDWNELYKDFWEYDPASDTWTRKADFGGVGRKDAIGLSNGQKGFVGIGEIGLFSFTDDFWEYTPE